MSKDPIGFKGGINLYRYTGNNPQRYTDPSGKCLLEIYIDNPELAQEIIDTGFLYGSEFLDGLFGEIGGETTGLPPTTPAGALGTFVGKGIGALDDALGSVTPLPDPTPLPAYEAPPYEGNIGGDLG